MTSKIINTEGKVIGQVWYEKLALKAVWAQSMKIDYTWSDSFILVRNMISFKGKAFLVLGICHLDIMAFKLSVLAFVCVLNCITIFLLNYCILYWEGLGPINSAVRFVMNDELDINSMMRNSCSKINNIKNRNDSFIIINVKILTY